MVYMCIPTHMDAALRTPFFIFFLDLLGFVGNRLIFSAASAKGCINCKSPLKFCLKVC